MSLDDLLQEATASLSLAAAPPGASVSFASPVAASPSPASMEGVVGSTEGMVDTKRCYSVVLIPGSDRSLCFGLIGVGGSSFCVRKGCKIKSHGTNKIPAFDDSRFFIFRVSGATVFSQPSVPMSKVPSSTQAEWAGKEWSLPMWVKAFRAVTNADDELASEDDIKSEVKLLDEAEVFRTPAKKRKAQVSLSEPLSTIVVPNYRRTLPVEGDTGLEAMIEGGSLGRGGLTRIVSRLESVVVEMGRTLEEVASLSHGRFLDNEQTAILMAGAVQNLMSSLGSAVEMDPKFEAPTLWGTTSFIGEEVDRLGLDVNQSKVETSEVVTEMKSVVGRMDQVEKSKVEDEAKIVAVLTSVIKRIQGVGSEIEAIKTDVAKHDQDLEGIPRLKKQRVNLKQDSKEDRPVVDHLMTLLNNDTKKSEVEMEEGNESLGVSDASIRTEEELRRFANEIRMLSRDVGVLKANTEDKSIKFGGLGIRDLSECSEWVVKNFSSYRYGLVMDPLLMLDRIFGSDDMDADTQFKVLESRVKLKIKTGAEAAAIKALHFNRPRLFHKGRVAMTNERNTSKLSKLPHYKSWKSGGEGVMNHVIKQMNLIHSTVAHDIEYAFGHDLTMIAAKAVATASLNSTVTFLTQLLGFVDAIYQKLHSDSKFSADQAWSLTTQILDRVCEDLYAPKEGVADAMTVEEPASICSHLLWACFRTHDVMKSYIDHHFENHPAISAEYVKFLATNSGFDKVEKMEVAVSQMKEKVEKALDIAERALTKASTITDKFSAANKEIETLKRAMGGMTKGK